MKRAAVILISILVLTMVVGCQTSKKPLTQDQNKTNNLQSSVNNNQAMADKFVNMAEQVPGVKKAYVAISSANTSGNNAGNISSNPREGVPNAKSDPMSPNAKNTRDRKTVNNEPLNNNGLNYSSLPNPSSNKSTSSLDSIVVMVGLELDNPKDVSSRAKIEKMVEQKIKNDNRVSQVMVTTDAGMVKEINNLNTSIKNGMPVNNIQTTINNLTRRLTSNK